MAKGGERKRRSIGLVSDRDAPLRGRPQKPRDPSQPQLSLDPMPDRVEPCLPTLSSGLPNGDEWSYEVKWDGYRVAVHVGHGNRVRILTRNGYDWTSRFPTIARSIRELGSATMILDGEAVVLDDHGRSDFNALVAALGGRRGADVSADTVLMAFDLLYLDGHDLRGMALEERRLLLEQLIGHAVGAVRFSEMIDAEGKAVLESARELGLEGIVAKRLSAPYTSGRTKDWIKVKCVQSDLFVILGYERSGDEGGIKNLLVGARRGDDVVSVGFVGTGFSIKTAQALKHKLDAIRIQATAIGGRGRDIVYVDPVMAARIEYRGWTAGNRLRQASFKGVIDSDAVEAIHTLED